MKIADFMIKEVITVQKDVRIVDLLKLLVDHRIGGVPVVDESGKLVTMISDGDVLRFLQPNGRSIYDMLSLVIISEKENLRDKLESSMLLPVEKMIRKKDIYTLRPDDEIEKAIEILARHRFKKIPVLNEDGKVAGVVSRGDIIRYISTSLIND